MPLLPGGLGVIQELAMDPILEINISIAKGIYGKQLW